MHLDARAETSNAQTTRHVSRHWYWHCHCTPGVGRGPAPGDVVVPHMTRTYACNGVFLKIKDETDISLGLPLTPQQRLPYFAEPPRLQRYSNSLRRPRTSVSAVEQKSRGPRSGRSWATHPRSVKVQEVTHRCCGAIIACITTGSWSPDLGDGGSVRAELSPVPLFPSATGTTAEPGRRAALAH